MGVEPTGAGSTDARTALAFAFQVTPLFASEQESRLQGFRNLIDRPGVESGGVPRALARYSGADEVRAARAVELLGVDIILATMALPPTEREGFLAGMSGSRDRPSTGLAVLC